jgi:circadian clock protein KaiB
VWEFRLYVADTTPRSLLAAGNVERLCAKYLGGDFQVTVVDIMKHPSWARRDAIVAVPTLVRVTPGPQKTVIGTLSDTKRALAALDMLPGDSDSAAACAGIRVGNA